MPTTKLHNLGGLCCCSGSSYPEAVSVEMSEVEPRHPEKMTKGGIEIHYHIGPPDFRWKIG